MANSSGQLSEHLSEEDAERLITGGIDLFSTKDHITTISIGLVVYAYEQGRLDERSERQP